MYTQSPEFTSSSPADRARKLHGVINSSPWMLPEHVNEALDLLDVDSDLSPGEKQQATAIKVDTAFRAASEGRNGAAISIIANHYKVSEDRILDLTPVDQEDDDPMNDEFVVRVVTPDPDNPGKNKVVVKRVKRAPYYMETGNAAQARVQDNTKREGQRISRANMLDNLRAKEIQAAWKRENELTDKILAAQMGTVEEGELEDAVAIMRQENPELADEMARAREGTLPHYMVSFMVRRSQMLAFESEGKRTVDEIQRAMARDLSSVADKQDESYADYIFGSKWKINMSKLESYTVDRPKVETPTREFDGKSGTIGGYEVIVK